VYGVDHHYQLTIDFYFYLINSQSNYGGEIHFQNFVKLYHVDSFIILESLVYGWMNVGNFDG
jgi:hypothetical protein